MKSVVLAVIFAGLLSTWSGNVPSPPTDDPSNDTFITAPKPLSSDPDDDEDDHRVSTRRTSRRNLA